ncbi:hypothetical protein Gasu2_18440 [Galdieria sulphuraria]|nr:hypothetical protein Gasu2_18440 [Galdieria sulphuraria]
MDKFVSCFALSFDSTLYKQCTINIKSTKVLATVPFVHMEDSCFLESHRVVIVSLEDLLTLRYFYLSVLRLTKRIGQETFGDITQMVIPKKFTYDFPVERLAVPS